MAHILLYCKHWVQRHSAMEEQQQRQALWGSRNLEIFSAEAKVG